MDGAKRVIMVSIVMLTGVMFGMDQNENSSSLKVYVVPGLGGYKPEEEQKNKAYADMLFNPDECGLAIDKTYITTPSRYGLAQEQSTQFVQQGINADVNQNKKEGKDYDKRVILAFSQGAATIAHLMREKKLTVKPDLVIWEGLFLSANDALHDSIHGQRAESYGLLQGLPFVRYWLPYLAQALKFPHYRPAGAQPLHALPHVSKELPLIIIHGKSDQRVSHDNALVLYSWLRSQGKDNVYLISKEASHDAIAKEKDHVTVLDKSDVPGLHAILRKHNILPAKESREQIDVSLYQQKIQSDDLAKYIALYHAKHSQHNVHERVEQAINAVTVTATLALTYWAYKSLMQKKNGINGLPDTAFYVSNAMAFLDQYMMSK